MSNPLYEKTETDSALDALAHITTRLPEPFLLLGGWGVFVTVNDSFNEEHGSDYLGSRDIDVCFHIDPTVSEAELRSCTFSRALSIVQEIGYFPHGFCRFCRIIKKDTGETITETAAKTMQYHELFNLYVDMMVDNLHPLQREVFGFVALDEPILGRVFNERTGVKVNYRGVKLMIPPPVMLLATKLKSIPNREKGDKMIKDACDIYALLWHSPENYRNLLKEIHTQYPVDCITGFNAITAEISRKAAYHLGVDAERYRDVIKQLNEI